LFLTFVVFCFYRYPSDLSDDSDVSIGRGRLIPTTSWEAVWNGVGEWFGVNSTDMNTVLPQKGNFPSLFSAADLFD